jgi:lipopolysaccharide transport system ATP-binding protein
MSEPIIEVDGVGKQYIIGHEVRHDTLRDALSHGAKGVFSLLRRAGGRRRTEREAFWALKDVSFKVRRGEVLGIIGRNGAGKSTLLKVLSRITEPTEGKVRLRGRVASLLEVGTGFHPELTGRENIFLNGAILGMTHAEISKKFDEIVAFAEVEKFIDTPVKRYSSGMYVRLAFAVAAHLDPEILIIDEVLAVGDVAFQQKCLGRMDSVARGGRTVLFVSHNMPVVQNLCQRAILLRDGRVLMEGATHDCVAEYLKSGTADAGEVDVAGREQGYDSELRFVRVGVFGEDGRFSSQTKLSSGVGIEVEYRLERAVRGAQICVELWNELGICVLCTSDFDTEPRRLHEEKAAGPHRARCRVPTDFLRPGHYTVSVSSSVPNVRPLAELQNVLGFHVVDDGSVMVKLSQGRRGVVLPVLKWEVAVP